MIEKRWVPSHWIWVGDGCSPLLSPRSLSSARFYFKINRLFLSEMPEMYSTDTFSVQILRIWMQQEKNREKTAREASKRGESGSLTEIGKLYRCRSFNSIFYPQKSYLKLFLILFCELSQAGLSKFSWDSPVNFIWRRNPNMFGQNM